MNQKMPSSFVATSREAPVWVFMRVTLALPTTCSLGSRMTPPTLAVWALTAAGDSNRPESRHTAMEMRKRKRFIQSPNEKLRTPPPGNLRNPGVHTAGKDAAPQAVQMGSGVAPRPENRGSWFCQGDFLNSRESAETRGRVRARRKRLYWMRSAVGLDFNRGRLRNAPSRRCCPDVPWRKWDSNPYRYLRRVGMASS